MDKRKMPKIGEEVSRLGMGLMRLPTKDGQIDDDHAFKMIDRLMEAGVTYYDTAYFYHGHKSEDFARRALIERFPRDKFTIATKMPLGDVQRLGGAQVTFDLQQKNLGADHIDFYLMHGVNENAMRDIAHHKADEVMVKMKKDGRVRYNGFSYHGNPGKLGEVLDGFDWDFCMVVLNYFDWIGGEAEKLYKAATERNIPLIVMEPVRGGGLARCHPHGVIRDALVRLPSGCRRGAVRYERYGAGRRQYQTFFPGRSALGRRAGARPAGEGNVQ
jgi:hypothetical protein